MFKKTKQAPR